MSKIPYWLISYWGFDVQTSGEPPLVVMLKYDIYKKLKEEHEELKITYKTVVYDVNESMPATNVLPPYFYDEKNYNKFNPDFDISEELAFYLALIEGKDLLD